MSFRFLLRDLNSRFARTSVRLSSRRSGRRSAVARITLGIEALESRQLLALSPELVVDINSAPIDGPTPGPFVEIGGVAYFTAETPAFGWELWRTDGTAAGTRMVKDIRPGPDIAPAIHAPVMLTAVGETLFFTADDGVSGYELWKSDGTDVGTMRVADIRPGAEGSIPISLTNADGELFFAADDGVHGRELWKSDGTAAGTVLVAESIPGGDGTTPSSLLAIDGALYFGTGYGLWKSDGTAAGTGMIKDGFLLGGVTSLTNVNGKLFFEGRTSGIGSELWMSDGTEAGTVLVKELAPGTHTEYRCVSVGYYGCYAYEAVEYPNGSYPTHLTSFNGQLFFTAVNVAGQRQLYRSDGTEAGTEPAAEPSGVAELTVVGGQLMFVGANSATGTEIWATDGTAGEIRLLKDIVAGSGGSSPTGLANIGGALFFTANDGVHGSELWKSDGTTSGTARVANVQPLARPIDLDGAALFAVQGPEIWTSDGTAAGTNRVAALSRRTQGSGPRHLTAVGDALFFSANDGVHGDELWKSDGTAVGTTLVKDISPGCYEYGDQCYPFSTYIPRLFDFDGMLYFAANSALWKSDGTPEGTVPVKSDGRLLHPNQFTNVDGELYFVAGAAHDGAIWKSDGTPAGTVLVKGGFLGDTNNRPRNLTAVDGTLFFTADNGNGYELWKSDGTEAGTVEVRDIRLGAYGSAPAMLTEMGGELFFAASDGRAAGGLELWKSDGTKDGTVLVKDIFPGVGEGGSYPMDLFVFNHALYFRATSTPLGGPEIWKSDGTEVGTERVDYLRPVGDFSLSANVDGKLFFNGYSAENGQELWVTDGTEAGTSIVRDLAPGSRSDYICDGFDAYGNCNTGHFEVHPNSAAPNNLIAFQGELYFTAADDSGQRRLYKSDGTESGTVPVAHLMTGVGIYEGQFTLGGDNLYFPFDDVIHGQELWKVTLEPPLQLGDTDDDGDVDLSDLNNVRNHFGDVGDNLVGDTNRDGRVDLADLNEVRNYFGASATAASFEASPTELNHTSVPDATAPSRTSIFSPSAALMRYRSAEADVLFTQLGQFDRPLVSTGVLIPATHRRLHFGPR
jgi:ELWxxDGT repeat protein